MKDKDQFLYDVRIVDRNLKEGKITQAEYKKYLKSLDDAEDKGEPLEFEGEDAVEEQVEAEAESALSEGEETE